MWKEKSISVILPTYNEKDSIAQSVKGFFATGVVDEVLVVNNNAVDGTDEALIGTGAVVVHETQQGYGYAIRRGLKEANGDLVVIAEPDGTFMARDIIKLLAFSEDFPVVYGTRTLNTMIWEGANMGWFLRLGNYFVAKFIEVVFNTTSLSDVGCTYRLLDRESVKRLDQCYTVGGSHFGLEMMLLTVEKGIRFIQIPVNYRKRVGRSSVTGSRIKAVTLGMTMIGFIIFTRIRTLLA